MHYNLVYTFVFLDLILTFKALNITTLTTVLCFTLKIFSAIFSHSDYRLFTPFLGGICGIHYKGCDISHYTSRRHYKWQGPCTMDCFIRTLFLFWCRASTASTLHVPAVVVWSCHSFIFVNDIMSGASKYDRRSLSHILITLISPAAPPSTSLLSTTHLPHHEKTRLLHRLLG